MKLINLFLYPLSIFRPKTTKIQIPIIFSIFFIPFSTLKGQMVDTTTSPYKWHISHGLIVTEFHPKEKSQTQNVKETTRGMELNLGRYLKKGIWISLPFRVGFPKSTVDSTGKPYYSTDLTILKEFTWKKISIYASTGSSVQFIANKANFGIPFSGGVNFKLDKGFFLNLQTTYRYNLNDFDNNYIYSGGLSFRFGEKKKKIKPLKPTENKTEQKPTVIEPEILAEAVNPWIVKDADADGVVDSLDRCPSIAGPMSNWGCPIKVSKPMKTDTVDTALKNNSIATNSNTQSQTIESTFTIYFDFDKYLLSQNAKNILNDIIAQYQYITIPELKIEGYADAQGSVDYNLKLSQKRAEQCINYLINNNLKTKRIVVQAYGEQFSTSNHLLDRMVKIKVFIRKKT